MNMDNDRALPIEKVAPQLGAYREELVGWLQETLEDTLFSNRVFIRPSHLKQLAIDEADAFFAFLKNEDATAIRMHGAKRAEDGLGKQSVLRIGTTLRRFCLTYLDGDLTGFIATDVYTDAFLEGFIEASESIILAEQESIRSALQRALSRYTSQLQTAAEVTRATTSILDPNELMTTSVDIIRERFGLYYAGIFLVDEHGEWAVLRAGAGETGQKMLQGDYKLKVGEESTVGWCISYRQPRIALDVGNDAVLFDKTFLPETRSEMVLPLISRGRVIGAMSLQSSGVSTFSDEDITMLQPMAGQLANAIENARLYMEAQQEIAERKQAEEALRESEELFRTIVDAAPSLLMITDAKGNNIYVGPNCEQFVGYTQEELQEETRWWVHEDDTPRTKKTIDNAFREKMGSRDFEYKAVKKDGESWYASSSWEPFIDKEGKFKGFVLQTIDITSRKRAEEQLQRYAVELEQRNEELKQFTYIVSHDLRAPLVNIKGFAAELRISLEAIHSAMDAVAFHLDEKQKQALTIALQEDVPEALNFIDSSVTRMDSFISVLLKLARLGRRVLDVEPIDMNALVQATLKTLAHQIEERQVKVTVAPLPEVIADRTSMEQIMGNILNNAVIYLAPDRPGEIELTAERRVNETTFHVHDNGRGIAKADMPQVFAPFRRAGRQDVPGEGMGLAYVQTLVRRHGGRILCESEEGVGTTFTFTISNHLKEGEL